MESGDLQVVALLVRVRSWLRTAEASTADMPHKLAFKATHSDGWPVLRLVVTGEGLESSPKIKIQGTAQKEIILKASFREQPQRIAVSDETATEVLYAAVSDLLSEMLMWLSSQNTLDESTSVPTTEDISAPELFDNIVEPSDEPIEALPDLDS